MTKKKTGHHYVPNKSYLANFADSSGKVWVLDATDKIFSTNPTNIFKEQHFYTINLKGAGESLVVEDTLANIEGDFAGIYRQKITDLVPLSIEEKARVSIFLGALHLRTKSQREGLHGALEQLHSGMKEWRAIFENNQAAREFSAKTMPTGGESIRLDDVEDALANIGQLHSTSMMDNLPEISQLIFEMDWQYLPAAAGMTFVTSEDPFRVLRPEALKKYGPNAIGSVPGLGWSDAEFTIPLSATLALYGARKGVGDGVLEIDQRQHEQINYRTTMYAKEMIVASNSAVLEEIKTKILKRENSTT